jgi:hypothetical protein
MSIVNSPQLHRRSKMAVVKPEVVIIQALFEIDMKFQWLNHHFQDGLHNHACGRFHQITVTPEIQDGAYETGNSYNSGAVSDRYAVPTAKIFVSTTAIKTVHVAIVSSTQLHRKSDMAAVKPEVVIIPALYPLDMKFQLVRHFLDDGLQYHAWVHCHQYAGALEIQHGGSITGNCYKSGPA